MDLIIKKYCKKNDLLVWDKFIINDSLNGTIYHTRIFLSYHENRFIDNSIMIYDKKKLIAVFPCCKINQEYYTFYQIIIVIMPLMRVQKKIE